MSAAPANPCASCGACCRSYIVPVSGYDVWLISTRERLSPEQFLIACPQPEPERDGFRLQHDGGAYGLALDKQGKFAAGRSCIFLLHLGGGQDRCGIYDHRPSVCWGYPMAIWSGVVFQRKDTLCPPDAWPREVVARPGWREALQRYYMHMDIYHAVVARWNARVAAKAGRVFGLPEYYTYLLNAYDRLGRLMEATGLEELAAVQASWPTVPRAEGGLPELLRQGGTRPWMAYYQQVSAVIAGLYPDLPAG